MPIVEIVFTALFGLAFGSFLNVCISRLPGHRSIVRPASHCPHCQAPIPAYDNIPLLSYLLLRGRCRACSKPIAWRYPLVEAAVGALAVGNLFVNGANYWGVAFTVFCGLLVALAACDIETMRLPDTLTLPLLALGILYRAGDGLVGEWHRGAGYAGHAALMLALRGAISAVSTGLALLLVRWVYSLLRRRQGLGLGDVKLAAGIAAWLGARQMCIVFFLAIVSGAVTALVLLAWHRRKLLSHAGPLAIPFGAFLAFAGIYTSFRGWDTLEWYFKFFR